MTNKFSGPVGRSLCTGVLFCSVILSVQAEWGLPVFSEDKLTPAAMDRAFECEVDRVLDMHADETGRGNAVVTRFGNTVVITGQVSTEADRKRVDQLVLDAAGITREENGSTTVVPASTLACDGKSASANTKRRLILKPGRDCSSLRAGPGEQYATSGRVFNHLAVGAGDPDTQRAHAELLAARARVALLDSTVVDVMDGNVIRLVAQQGVLYVLGGLDAGQQSAISDVLERLPGVTAVHFYIE